jgi:hypothetical protein
MELLNHIQDLNKTRNLLFTEELTVWHYFGVFTPEQFDQAIQKDYDHQVQKQNSR